MHVAIVPMDRSLVRRTRAPAAPYRVRRPSTRVAALTAGTLDAAVDDILDVTTPVALPAYIDHDIEDEGWDQYVYAVQWWFDRMVDSPKPIQEKMTFFWHGHFTSAWNKVDSTRGDDAAEQAVPRHRRSATSVTLTQAMAIAAGDAASTSTTSTTAKGSPNQNFARELLELFTLGVGNYAESRRRSGGAAWTGHTIEWDEASPNY